MASNGIKWSKSAVAGTCVDLLTEGGISTGGQEVKEGRIERENFFGVKIVNAGTCNGKGNIFGKEGVMDPEEGTTKATKSTKEQEGER
jgi:hypothetical protein